MKAALPDFSLLRHSRVEVSDQLSAQSRQWAVGASSWHVRGEGRLRRNVSVLSASAMRRLQTVNFPVKLLEEIIVLNKTLAFFKFS